MVSTIAVLPRSSRRLCLLVGACFVACASPDDEGATGLSTPTSPVTSASAASSGGASETAGDTTGDASSGTSVGSGASASTSATTTATSATTNSTGDATGDATSSGGVTGDATTGEPDPRAYLHADLWSTWWNDRTRCGAERTFLEICERRGEACSLYQQAYAACDPSKIIYGQVGPEKQGEALCQRGKFPAIGGCVASAYDFAALRFYWYGAEWQGNWPVATLKVFPAGADWKGGGELIALSNHPGKAQAAIAAITNHGLDYGCVMPGSDGDDRYLRPFGAFAWVEVPTGQPVTVVGAAATNFGDMAFAGCNRGQATQDPWVTASSGAQLGCVYVVENMVFEPGKHYAWRYGQLVEVAGPPAEIVAGFALPELGVDVGDRDACALP